MIDAIRELYDYDRWANRRTLDAVSRLDAAAFTEDMGSSYPSVRDTLVHIMSAEWVWLMRWQGESPTGMPASWELSTFDALRTKWEEVERELAAFVAGLDDADLDRVVDYRNTRGTPYANSMAQMLRHVVNHSTYHRAQVTTLLRQLGAEPVNTDLITFYRETGSEDLRTSA